MGSAAFSLPTLLALIAAGHDVAAVYSQPPRPAGRGHRAQRSLVHAYAESQGLDVRTPTSLRDEIEQQRFADLQLDAAVVAAYGLILPKATLQAPRLGCINVHGSLLPRWRGAAPVERALLEGDTETGITIMQMDEGLDTGPMLATQRLPIGLETTAAELRDALADLGARLLVDALADLASGTLTPVPQPPDGATYARKLGKDEGRIDWAKPALRLHRMVRALSPSPGVWFEYAGERIKVLAADLETGVLETGERDLFSSVPLAHVPGERDLFSSVPLAHVPGTVLDDRLTVACGDGALRPRLLQRPGRGPTETSAFLRGYPLPAGLVLG
ncbi:MAG: methionyl-tRNA formyltransferase [Defluviicoccus sp.]|nr:MAG: methionyl-tRNA formyltransferase [Defluviicoccus sp.]